MSKISICTGADPIQGGAFVPIHWRRYINRRPSTPLKGYIHAKPISNTRSPSILTAGTACSTKKSIASSLKDALMICSLTQRYAIGASSSSWTGSILKTQEESANFHVQLRIQNALEAGPFASVRCVAEAMHTPPTSIFCILTEISGLRFCHCRWVPNAYVRREREFNKSRKGSDQTEYTVPRTGLNSNLSASMKETTGPVFAKIKCH
jgi:hypothetical protein